MPAYNRQRPIRTVNPNACIPTVAGEKHAAQCDVINRKKPVGRKCNFIPICGEKLINTYFFQIGLSNHLPVQYGLGRGQARSMPSGSCGKTLLSANSAVAVLAASECVTAYMSPKSRGLAPVCIYEPLPLLLQASERWAA